MNVLQFTVIIPVYNAVSTLSDCLESIFSNQEISYEVIVVNDASTDNSMSIAKKFPCLIVPCDRNSGPAVARNHGASHAQGEFLAFTDADCTVPSDWLKKFYRVFLNNNNILAISGGYSKNLSKGFISQFQFRTLEYRQMFFPSFIESSISSNFAVRKRIFDKVGGFPKYFRRSDLKREHPVWGNEDEELGFLISREGLHGVRWLPENGIGHFSRNSWRSYIKQQIFYAKSAVASHFNHPQLYRSTSNYKRKEVMWNIGLTTFFYLAILLTPLGFLGWSCILTAVIFSILTEFQKLRYFYRSEGTFSFALKGYIALQITYSSWLCGIVRGVVFSKGGFVK